jgi:YfiH family protein
MCTELGIPDAWASVRQVHGATVLEADRPGLVGEADAIFTRREGLPLVIRTADCVPVILESDGAVAVVHAGWRGIIAGVIESAVAALRDAGEAPRRGAIGPAIGPCCYEVGPEVAGKLAPYTSTTTWGTTSVDLRAAVRERLDGIDLWTLEDCTMCRGGYHSHRRDRSAGRQVSLAWR